MGVSQSGRTEKSAIQKFLQNNPDFDPVTFDFFDKSAVQALLQAGGLADTDSSPTEKVRASGKPKRSTTSENIVEVDALQAYQRMLRLTGDGATAEVLVSLGLDSAAIIAAMSPARFVQTTKPVFGDDEAAARAIHAKAGHIKTAALHLYGSVKELVASPSYRKAAFNSVTPELVDYFTQIPSYTELFANMNYFETDPGQTVFSPAAYFFDLMRIIDEYVTHPNTTPIRTIPQGYTLEERRPDLFKLKLTPANTFDEVPTLALVNDILAHLITARGMGEAYQYLALASYPFNLPFNRPLLALRRALAVMQCPLVDLYRAMEVDHAPPAADGDNAVLPLDVAREATGLSIAELVLVTKPAGDAAYSFPGSGIVGTVAGSPDVVGIGTRFTSDIAAGDWLTIGPETHKVAAIASDTALTVESPWTEATAVSYEAVRGENRFPGKGTIDGTTSNDIVTGRGTSFSIQVRVGDRIAMPEISIDGIEPVRTVTAIVSDTSLTVDHPWPLGFNGIAYTIIPFNAGKGEVAVTQGSSTVTGTDTGFTTQVRVGDEITITFDHEDLGFRTVAEVISDDVLRVTQAWPVSFDGAYKIELPGSGVVAITAGETTATGTGTSFFTQVKPGDSITIRGLGDDVGLTHVVTSILSDISLTVERPWPTSHGSNTYLITSGNPTKGKVAIEKDDTTIRGTGTKFLTDVKVHDAIGLFIDQDLPAHTVTNIVSDKSLTVDRPWPASYDGKGYKITSVRKGAGGIVYRRGETGVVGISTAFIADFAAGSEIRVGDVTVPVTKVASDTSLTVATPWSEAAGAGYLIALADGSEAAVSRAYGYDIPRTSPPFAGTGIVGSLAGLPRVIGIDTRFQSEIVPGDQLTIGHVTHTVNAIESDTALTVDTPWKTTNAVSYVAVPAPGTGQPHRTFPGTATITIKAGSNEVVQYSSNTNFRWQFTPGDKIIVEGETRTVVEVISDAKLTIDQPFSFDKNNVPYQVDWPYRGFPGANTINVRADSTDVVEYYYSTNFLTWNAPGDKIIVGGETRTIVEVISNTKLTIDQPFTSDGTNVFYRYIPTNRTFVGKGQVYVRLDKNEVWKEGSDASFLRQVAPGDRIIVRDHARTVTDVLSDTNLKIDRPFPFAGDYLSYLIVPGGGQPPAYIGSGGIIYKRGDIRVEGIGTTFTVDFANGGSIRAGDVTIPVAKVDSDTSATVEAGWRTDGGAGLMIAPPERSGRILDMLPKAGTGTVELTKDSTRLTGSGTAFRRQIQVGDQIVFPVMVGDETHMTRTVTEIISDSEAELDSESPITQGTLHFTILAHDGLDVVDVFRERTGLTPTELTALLRQNLDDAEFKAGGADGFFINDTGETPATITTYFSNDPGNPVQRLSGLTLKRLDRISRFVRLAHSLGWSFTDLQWAMTASGATEITDALVMALGRIAALMESEKLGVVEITALFHDLKTTGRVDQAKPQDPFDKIYNAPMMLKGADPYAKDSSTPFDPFRQPPQLWNINPEEGKKTGTDEVIRSRLRAALQVKDADLTRLAVYVQCLTGAAKPDEMSLTLANLSWLWRLAATAKRFGWTVDAYLTFLGLAYYPTAKDYFLPPKDAVSFALDKLTDQFALAHWVEDSDFDIAQIQYVVNGTAQGFSPPYAEDDVASFMADLAAIAASTHLSSTTLAAVQLDAAQADALFDKLVKESFVTATGIVLPLDKKKEATDHTVSYNAVADLLPVHVGGNDSVFGFNDASFASANKGISAEESKNVYAALLQHKPPILEPQPSGTAAVAQSFGQATNISFLASFFSNGAIAKVETVRQILLAARDGIDSLINILDQTLQVQHTTFTRALASFIGVAQPTVTALLPFASERAPLPDYLEVFLTPLPEGSTLPKPALAFIAEVARFGLVAGTCRLNPVETAYFTSTDGGEHFNIHWPVFNIRDISDIAAYVTLRNAVGADRAEIITYFKTPADNKDRPGGKAAALVAATGWDARDVDVLTAYFWPKPAPDDANTVVGLTRLAAVFDIERRLGVRAQTLKELIATSHLPIESKETPGSVDPAHWKTYEDAAETARGIVSATFSDQARTDADATIDGEVNAASRNALVGNVLWWMNAANPTIVSVNDLYRYLLLDVEMGSCTTTSPIAQAIASAQLYLQRARMMQESGVLTLDIPEIWWSWMMNYRIWEANRRIFLYPENYLEPSLRQDATPDFETLASELLQNAPTKDNVVKPFQTFLKALAVLGGLTPAGAYQALRRDPQTGEEKDTLFVVGRTRAQPYQFYFCTLDNAVEWSPWQAIDLTIAGERLSPIHAFSRLFIFWSEFDRSQSGTVASQNSSTQTIDKATLRYAFYNDGEWSPAQLLDDMALLNTYPSPSYSPGPTDRFQNSLRRKNSYWQFPYVLATGRGFVGTGRVEFSKDSAVLNGVRTQFTREVRAGDTVVCFGESRIVSLVANNDQLVVTQPWSGTVEQAEYKIIPVNETSHLIPFTGTGKVSTTANSAGVTGKGTRFLDEVALADRIAIGGESYVVLDIQSHEQLTVNQNWTDAHKNAAYTVASSRRSDEAIMVGYSTWQQTVDAGSYTNLNPVPNGTEDTFIAARNSVGQSVTDAMRLAYHYRPAAKGGGNPVAGYVPVSNCTFLDANLARSSAKVLWADYAYGSEANGRPYRPELPRQFARLSVHPSDNLLYDNYWGTNLPGLLDSDRNPTVEGSVDLLFNINADKASLLPVGNKPGSFLFDNGDETFLVRPDDPTIRHLSETLLRSPRPWPEKELVSSQILSTGNYTALGSPLAETRFSFTRLSTSVMPELQRRLFLDGIDALLSPASQYLPELPFDRFSGAATAPEPQVVPPTSTLMDFDGAFGLYFWELFFHAPFLVADRLQGVGKFEDALSWLQYIFNPMQPPSADDGPESATRFWRFRPFRHMDQPSLAANLTDPRQIKAYNNDPFDPDAIAAIRHVAYAKAIVMRYVDAVLDWGDALFTQYTRETITQATNLYVLAQDLLGAKPVSQGRLPLPQPKSFSELKAKYKDEIPQFLVDLENTPFLTRLDDNARYASQPVNDVIAYFAVPENADFMKYWDRVDDRLFKIRHCMNIDGQAVPLALFAPPIDPAMLIQAMAGGGAAALANALTEGVPHYRFDFLIERAQAIVEQLIRIHVSFSLNLTRRDAEALSLLTTEQENLLLKMTTMIKEQDVAEAEANGKALEESLASAHDRQAYYVGLISNGISAREQSSLDSMIVGKTLNMISGIVKASASIGYALPQAGSPFAMTYGGAQIGAALTSAATVLETAGAVADLSSKLISTFAIYERRAQEWRLQQQIAAHDVAQIDNQIQANSIRIALAKQGLVIQEETIRQNRERASFLKDKFTNKALFQWMVNQISRIQFQTYTVAHQLALTAQRAYQFEYNSDRRFVTFDYWDAAHGGLTSGEGLQLALTQMAASVLDTPRSLEIERTISLTDINPLALVQLREKGECFFEFSESLFDHDFPGHYCRKIKTLSVSIVSAVGPYRVIKGTLTQLSNQVVLKSDNQGLNAVKFLLGEESATVPPASAMRSNWRNHQEIVLSNGQEDSGLFALNLEDSRYLPFEGTGAVSSWLLSLPKGTNHIAFDAISDVTIRLKYTASDGGDAFRRKVAELAELKTLAGFEYIDCRSMYSDAWQRLFAPVGPTSDTQTLSLPITDFVPPHVDNAKLMGFYIRLSADQSVAGSYISVDLSKQRAPDEVKLDAANTMSCMFGENDRPYIKDITSRPAEIIFDLKNTPAALKTDGKLNADALKNIEIVFYYVGDVKLSG
ncbi:hypothetical protein PHO31112_05027 [Pandoraea horticolens]|uniref:Uncharacterized protein n=1 Tax=Pandoraea horticolens TaxID=2508298 RepID=A0A5E4Z3C2_9BURK|nr:neuraminidase-like domain-containing protein [Pandoraea horticolens]VVE55751.1 hypothetical protein PHO31112_05027 [Pandoraea horticolens]